MNAAAVAASRTVAPAVGRLPPMVYYMLAATLTMFIAANAFGSTVTSVINAGKWAPLLGLLAVSLNAFRGRRIPAFPPTMLFWLGAFLLIATISCAFSVIGFSSFGSLLSIVLVVLTGYATAAIIVATNSRRQVFDLVANIGRVLVVSVFLLYVARIDLGRGGGFSAWVDNPNTLASMMAPGWVVFLAGCLERRKNWQYWHLPFLLVSIPLILATEGRASYLWIIVSALSFWVYRRGSWPTAFALMVGLIILIGWWEPITTSLMHWAQLDIAPEKASGIGPLSGREEVWRYGMELFWDNPVFGYGLGSSNTLIRAEMWRFVRFQGLHFHSSYIMALVETGLFGFVLFMGPMISTLVRGIADARRTSMLPRESWPTAALPFAMFMGALGHGLFESWLLAGGNVNGPLFWTIVWLIHFQAQIPIRAIVTRVPTQAAARRGPAYPAA